MKKEFILFVGLVLFVFANLFSQQVLSGDEKKAKDLVEKGIKFYQANGKDKLFEKIIEETNVTKGQLRDDELYLFVLDFNGLTLAHGSSIAQVGKNVYEIKDLDGKEFVKDFIKIAKEKGEGWVEYKWSNPIAKKLQKKKTYLKRLGDLEMFIGCGFYIK